MTGKEINEFKTKAATAVDNGRLCEAIDIMRALPQSALPYAVRNAVDAAEEHYRYLLKYFADGASDPARRDNYDDLRAELRMLVDRCVRTMQTESTPSLYYNKLRTHALHPERSISSVAAEMEQSAEALAGAFDVRGLDSGSDRDRVRLGELSKELLERVWTEFPLDKSSVETVLRLTGPDSDIGTALRMQLIAAVGLGLLEFYDASRFSVLAEILDTTSREEEAYAATAWLLTALFRYRRRRHPRSVRSRLTAAAEHPLWRRRVRDVYIEMLRARDTERVVSRVRDEIMPDIMKLGKDLMDKSSDLSPIQDLQAGPEINPEWEDKLRETGMYDRLREFSEMSAEGADIFMGAFSHLKTFPFFSDIMNWFAPFDDSQAVVSDALSGEMASFVDLLCRMPMPCDNDKYSILFTLLSTPYSKREMMARQLDEQRVAMEQAGMTVDKTHDSARSYVQNMYRFFKLFGRKGEFFDPFARKFFLQDIELVGDAVKDADTLRAIAELLFKIEAWEDARKCFESLAAVGDPSPEIYQKSGYCCEQLGRYEEAVESYSYSDLMDGTSAWTLRRLATVLRRSGNPERAVEVLSRLSRMQPDSESAVLNLAYASIEARRYDDAMRHLARAESMGAAGGRLSRAMAWCAFMSGDFDAARERYKVVLADNPDSNDYLNMGHLAWAEGRMSDAVGLYRRCMDMSECGADGLETLLRADLSSLARAGIDVSDMPLVLDAVRMDPQIL